MCTTLPRLVTIIVLCIHLFGIASSQLESRIEKRNSRRLCGRYLADAIQLVCEGNYNSPVKKKSIGDLISPEFMRPEAERDDEFWLQGADLEGLGIPLWPRFIAKALVPGSFRRVTRGVNHECCRKSCTYQEMLSYCAPSTSQASGSTGQSEE